MYKARENNMIKHKYNIKKDIEQKRATITELLHTQAKHLDDVAWIKSAFIKETLVLNQCQDQEIRHDTSSESIHNIGVTWDMIVSRTNITNFSLSDVFDVHYSLTQNTDVVPCALRTSIVYSLQQVVPADPSPEVTRQKIDDILFRLNSGKQSILQRAFDVHYELIALQPFRDFNKRTARMIMNWFLINRGYRPIAFNAATDNQDYTAALRMAASGDKKTYYNYMYKCMSRTQNMFIDKLSTYIR